jgi:acyl carrier protein
VNTKDIIFNFINNEMLHRPSGTPLGDDEQLVESGIIDSLGVMTMLSFLEEKFNIQIPGEDLVPENFESISAITALAERQMNKQKG